MELCRGWPCPHPYHMARHCSSSVMNSESFLVPSIFPQLSMENIFKGHIGMGNHRPIVNLVNSVKNVLPVQVLESWNIVWTLETTLQAGQQLFVTGNLTILGDWKPDAALRMQPVEGSQLWKAEIEVPAGINFKYNYFILNEEEDSHDIIWRPGPQVSLSVPCKIQDDGKISVMDAWMMPRKAGPSPMIWGCWAKGMLFPEKPATTLPPKTGLTDGDDELDVLHHPIEEPWLIQSAIIIAPDESVSSSDDDRHNQAENRPTLSDQRSHMFREDEKSTTILINTSVCTMQRIAVLEDEKLVELLLEPVKSDVQCDSVYLGVVTQLLPHMGGALVDIGSSRPAFMDVDQSREPFVIRPFNRKTMKEKDDAIASEGDQTVNGNLSDDLVDFSSSNHSESSMFEEQGDFAHADDLDMLDVKSSSGESRFDCDKLDDNFRRVSVIKKYSTKGKNSLVKEIADASLALNQQSEPSSWENIGKGTKIIVQVFKEGLGTKRPSVTAYPHLRSRFWILLARCSRIGVSRKIIGSERLRLKVIAKILQPPGFGLTVRTVAAGHPWKELHKDLKGLLSTWKNIVENAKSAALAADEGVEGAVPVILHRAMGQTLSVVQDYFNEKVTKMVVDSPRTYHEVTSYLQDIAPDLCDRVELYDKMNTLFGEYEIEEEINNILSKRVPLSNGGSLVIEQTEALVSIDVNGGHVMFGQGTSPANAVLEVNLAAAKQIARELRLRDIGGIIVVDFIDMEDDSNKRLVYEEMKRSVERDRSTVKVSELSKHGLMEITRKRVRPSVTFMVSEPCACCHGTGRVEALETIFSKIEQEICRLLASREHEADPQLPKTWRKFLLRVDHQMCNYLTAGKKTKLAILSSSLRVWILLKVARGFARGSFELKPFSDEAGAASQLPRGAIQMLRQTESKQLTVLTIKKGKARTSARKQAALASDNDL